MAPYSTVHTSSMVQVYSCGITHHSYQFLPSSFSCPALSPPTPPAIRCCYEVSNTTKHTTECDQQPQGYRTHSHNGNYPNLQLLHVWLHLLLKQVHQPTGTWPCPELWPRIMLWMYVSICMSTTKLSAESAWSVECVGLVDSFRISCYLFLGRMSLNTCSKVCSSAGLAAIGVVPGWYYNFTRQNFIFSLTVWLEIFED